MVMAKAMAPDPAIGVWKLDLDKSNFALLPAPKGSVMKVEAWKDALKVSADTIDAHGNRICPTIECKFDGADYPITDSPLADSISTIRINERKMESVWKKQGRVVVIAKAVISFDGKTWTVIITGMDPDG